MKESKTKKIIELKQSPTTIWIKRGTKDLLDSLGGRKDTYDDIIRSLIQQAKSKGQEVLSENVIKISSKNLVKSRLTLNNGYIEFLYHSPDKPLSRDFTFRIHYSKVYIDKKELPSYSLYSNPLEMAHDYLRMMEMVIKRHIDPLFNLDEKHLLDLLWWERMFKNMGLPYSSYKEDIEFELIKLGFAP